MSDRDRFAELSQKALSQEEMTQQDRQFWIEYILRYLKNKKTDDYALGDIIEWNFTGDNIVFNTTEITLQPDYLSISYITDIGRNDDEIIKIESLFFDGTTLYLGGRFTKIGGNTCTGVASLDASNVWTGYSGLSFGGIVSVTSSGVLHCGGDQLLSGYISAKWNGSSWDGVVPEGFIHYVYAMSPDTSGNIYIAGLFHDVGDANGDGVVKYDGTNFTSLGTGVGGNSASYVQYYNGNVYITGSFTSVGGSAIGQVAMWNGSTWSAYGTGLQTVGATTTRIKFNSAGVAYVNQTVGGVSYIYKYNVGTWDLIGTFAGGNVYDMAIDSNDTVFFVGSFTSVNGVTCQYIAAYKSSGWVNVGTCDIIPRAIAISPSDDIYLGGNTGGIRKLAAVNTLALLGYYAEDQNFKSTDATLAADSDILYPSQSAVRDYTFKKHSSLSPPSTDDDVTLDYRVGDMWIYNE